MIKEMPKIAIGTWLLKDKKVLKEVIKSGFEIGYKNIDTAQVYFNEEMIGEILEELKIARDDYWITTKIWPVNFKYHVYESLVASLKRLKTSYANAVLLHAMVDTEMNIHAYKELIKAREDGIVQNIGVSNWTIEELKTLYRETGEYPKYNQVITSVKQRMPELENFCKKHNITLMAYSTIRPYYQPNEFYVNSGLDSQEKELINTFAKKHNATPAQILLSYASSRDYVILPKTSSSERVISNYKSLDITFNKEELFKLDKLNTFGDKEYTAAMLNSVKNKQYTEEQYKWGIRLSKESDEMFFKLSKKMND